MKPSEENKIKQDFVAASDQTKARVCATTAQPRTSLDDLRQMMDTMDQRHADEVHYLFMANYIEYSDYDFRDEWQMDAYHEAYFYYYRAGDVDLKVLNSYVLDILKEWQQDAYHKYQEAKKDLICWIKDPIPEFKPSLGEDIQKAYDSAIHGESEKGLAIALYPFPGKIVEIMNAGHYEDAAANIFCLFEHLSSACEERKEWDNFLWKSGVMPELACFTEALCELYCHLREQGGLSASLKSEIDIHLYIFNNKTYFFGDMWGNSRFEDMLLDPEDQYGSYTILEECSMWKHWYLDSDRHK